MYNFMKKGAFMLLVACLAMGMASCSDDDPDYSNVTPPTVAVTHSISGRVTGINGEGLSATVSMNGTSAATKADGTFVFENVKAGTYTLKAEADGKESKETSVTVSDGDSNNPVWNVALSNKGTAINVEPDGSASGVVTSETLKGNEDGEIEMTLTAPAGAVEAGTQIIVTPIYSTDEVEQAAVRSAVTKAVGSTLLIGTRVSSSNASAELQESVTLEYDVDPKMAETITAQKYVNGTWVDAEYTVEGGKVTVVADQFASYSLWCNATISSSRTSEAVSFSPDSWDNLYGSGDVAVASSSYSYKIGTDISSSGTNKITAYLIEIVARAAGAGVTEATGTYPINVTLPVGTAMSISGQQEVTTLTASALGRNVSGRHAIILIKIPTTVQPEFRIHLFQIDVHSGLSRHSLHLAAFPIYSHRAEARHTHLCVQSQTSVNRIHPFHIQPIAFPSKQSTAHFQELRTVPVPFLRQHCHTQAYLLIPIPIIIINGDYGLTGQLPPVADVPFQTGSQVHQNLVHLRVEDIPIMQFRPCKQFHFGTDRCLRQSF